MSSQEGGGKATTKVQTIVAIVALVVAIFTLIYTNFQVRIARADLEARTSPYLSIEKIELNNTDYGWISTNITINNLGETPSTRVQFGEISLNGTKIAGTSQPDKDYPDMVVTPVHSGLPYDIIFFPQRPTTIELLTLGSVQESAITEGTVIDIGLTYSWGDKQYEYVATAVMSDGDWRVILHRGN